MPSGADGRFAYDGLDRVLHEKARLGIMASLASHRGGLLFNDLKQLCSLTDGNLSRHLTVLLESKLIEVRKSVQSGRPQTAYRLTVTGRKRFNEYINVLERVVADAQTDQRPDRRQHHPHNHAHNHAHRHTLRLT